MVPYGRWSLARGSRHERVDRSLEPDGRTEFATEEGRIQRTIDSFLSEEEADSAWVVKVA